MKAYGIALVGCGKSKSPSVAPARALYTSGLFRLSLAHAEARAERTFIVSAHYRLLYPGTLVAPYERTLHDLLPDEQHAWARQIVAELGSPLLDPRPLLLLAGGSYELLLRAYLELAGWGKQQVETPLHRMQIGERQHWLKERAVGVPAAAGRAP